MSGHQSTDAGHYREAAVSSIGNWRKPAISGQRSDREALYLKLKGTLDRLAAGGLRVASGSSPCSL